jgi:hypothetical protein
MSQGLPVRAEHFYPEDLGLFYYARERIMSTLFFYSGIIVFILACLSASIFSLIQ